MDKEIVIPSGVSWLHDTLRARMQERVDFLKEACANGLPYHEYLPMVGRHREALRMLNGTLPELFQDFAVAENESDDELEELDNE